MQNHTSPILYMYNQEYIKERDIQCLSSYAASFSKMMRVGRFTILHKYATNLIALFQQHGLSMQFLAIEFSGAFTLQDYIQLSRLCRNLEHAIYHACILRLILDIALSSRATTNYLVQQIATSINAMNAGQRLR